MAEASIAVTFVAEELVSASTVSFTVPREVADNVLEFLKGYPSESAVWDRGALEKADRFVEDESVALWSGEGGDSRNA